MKNRMVEVIGGVRDEQGVFQEVMRRTVQEQDLAVLFRRDWRLCGLPVIFLRNLH